LHAKSERSVLISAPSPRRSTEPGIGADLAPVDCMKTEATIHSSRVMRIQLLFAALMWTAAAVMLGSRSVGWLGHLHFGTVLAGVAVVLGWFKQHYIMRRVAGEAVLRIRERGPDANVFGFFALKQWILVGVMMGGGIVLRMSGLIPASVLGTLYATVAIGLLLGSGRFWQALALGE